MDRDRSKSIAAIMTCHNRKLKTILCLQTLYENQLPGEVALQVYLVDDGSTDGTSEAVQERFPDVNVIKADGSLFWNGGMRLAFETAFKEDHDYYLWLNDDTEFYSDTLKKLLACLDDMRQRYDKDVVVVGSIQHVDHGGAIYGGLIRAAKWKTTHFRLVLPSEEPLECETMNGNCVLVPKGIASVVGNLDAGFVHGMGDIDYGLRVSKAGYSLWVMPGFGGTSSYHSIDGTYHDTKLSLHERFRQILSPKGLPLKSWRIFTHRHAGPLWLGYWMWPYLKVVISSLSAKWVQPRNG